MPRYRVTIETKTGKRNKHIAEEANPDDALAKLEAAGDYLPKAGDIVRRIEATSDAKP